MRLHTLLKSVSGTGGEAAEKVQNRRSIRKDKEND